MARGFEPVLKVSQKVEYGMRAMIELAMRRERDGDVLVPARAIAESQRIPVRFLEQQLGALHKAGLVESFRGAGGGCRLSRAPQDIYVANIVDALEGPLYPMGCLSAEDHTCFADAQCGLQELWGDVQIAIRQVFERMTLEDMVTKHRKLTARPLFAPSDLLARPHV